MPNHGLDGLARAPGAQVWGGQKRSRARKPPLVSRWRASPQPCLPHLDPFPSLFPPFFLQDPDYVHAKHMYNITGMTNRKLKFGLGTIAVAGGGAAVTAIAVNHAQSKAKG